MLCILSTIFPKIYIIIIILSFLKKQFEQKNLVLCSWFYKKSAPFQLERLILNLISTNSSWWFIRERIKLKFLNGSSGVNTLIGDCLDVSRSIKAPGAKSHIYLHSLQVDWVHNWPLEEFHSCEMPLEQTFKLQIRGFSEESESTNFR